MQPVGVRVTIREGDELLLVVKDMLTPHDDSQTSCVPVHPALWSSAVHKSWRSGYSHVPANPSQTPDQRQRQASMLQSNVSGNGTRSSPPEAPSPLHTAVSAPRA